ncbi:SusD/RagB family nutrient-binding outer membrane lipoprotein [Chitinophaga sp. SYP-B3965]|uniref:SusD/RagB family nutrient-binding outer membrane lipoprotein n=1 Tax=Chitinophaga sp. SYP-B3965 TaxID=2663120 RepID=UPI001299E05B|nr:SusD/RagB family nutrient-binding outer membrane lipoprotein [Chitinophaga sp. SYP-B3965]MRG47937.1 SusD/RagB family nutrient-binding outer membrane lipoprotein [Chitinophaga sp. SYP-B3965]
MKKIIYQITGAVLILGMFVTSCTKDFTEINTNPNASPEALPQQLLRPALVRTLTYNMLRNRNFNNELMQVTVDASDAEGKVFRYDYRASWSDYLYNGWYLQLTNFKDIYKIASDSGIYYNRSYTGISLVCQAWIYSMLTDTYGDVPFSESNKAKTDSITEPKFDAQKDIYMGLFKMLDTANLLLTTNTAIDGSSDPVFNGNVSLWRRFCNSLQLRLLMRVSGKAEIAPMAIAKIKDMVDTRASTFPIMTDSSHSAILRWTGAGLLVSPFVGGVREQDFRTPGIASFFIDNLVAWNDPRISIPVPWGNGTFNRWGIAPASGAYLGIPSGYAAGENPPKKAYFTSNTSAVSMQTEPLAGMIMNTAEVKFILAEASLKKWINGSPATFYNAGARESIKMWLPTWNLDIQAFLAGGDVEWEEGLSDDAKMERIHLQKYYALFMEDLQQWFEYRRTGHPVLPKGGGLRNGGVMPARMTYPVLVQSTNPTNYKLAVAAQGPDQISTQVWWQKP